MKASAVVLVLFSLGINSASAFVGPVAYLPTRLFSPRRFPTRVPVHMAKIVIAGKLDGNWEEDDEVDNDESDADDEDPYSAVADIEFESTPSSLDWGGELGKLRQRMGDIDSGKSRDPSNALFRLMSAKTPNEMIGHFVQSANPKVVRACSDAVNSLLGGLSSPAMGIETIVKTNGEKIGNLCFQLQMTGYMFRNAEYVMALREILNLKGGATLEDYKEAFDTLDKDDSGFIETAEVRSLFDKVYDGKAPNFEVDTFVQFFDTNKDGKISWSEFEQGLGDAAQQQPSNYAFNLLPCAEEDDDTPYIEPEVSGEIEIELENGKIITVEAKEYVQSLKLEVEALKETLRREKLGQRTSNNGIVGSAAQSSGDFRGIAEYIASRQGDIKALTKGIKPEVIDSMKKLVDFVMEGGEGGTRKDVPRDQIEMELPGSALQQLALWQLVLGYRLREAEAKGEYWKLLE